MDFIREVQKILVEEYRKDHPEVADYSDEEIALINPVTIYDIEAYIDYQIGKLQKEIKYNMDIIDSPNTYYQEVTELRSENINLMREITSLVESKEQIRQVMGESLDESNSR